MSKNLPFSLRIWFSSGTWYSHPCPMSFCHGSLLNPTLTSIQPSRKGCTGRFAQVLKQRWVSRVPLVTRASKLRFPASFLHRPQGPGRALEFYDNSFDFLITVCHILLFPSPGESFRFKFSVLLAPTSISVRRVLNARAACTLRYVKCKTWHMHWDAEHHLSCALVPRPL